MNPLMAAMQAASSPMRQMGNIANIVKMLKSGSPDQIGPALMQKNPQFRQFVEENKGLSPEQIAQKYGMDFHQIMNSI